MSVSRRTWLKMAGLALLGDSLPMRFAAGQSTSVVEIHMISRDNGAVVGFDPVGVWVEPGTTLRWMLDGGVHTTTAYHPRNDHHPLRIPEDAQPWHSGYLVNPGEHFDISLHAEGVYDFYCQPHEHAGMVGRIIVGKPLGPGARPFDYFIGKSGTQGWTHVPAAARAVFPSVDDILRRKRIPFPSRA